MNDPRITEALKRVSPDDAMLIYSNGVKQGVNHSAPSPKTIEELNNLKINMTEIRGDLKRMEEKQDTASDMLKNHIEKEDEHMDHIRQTFDNFFSRADSKYASKRIEIIIWGGLGVVGSTLIAWAIKVLLSHGI